MHYFVNLFYIIFVPFRYLDHNFVLKYFFCIIEHALVSRWKSDSYEIWIHKFFYTFQLKYFEPSALLLCHQQIKIVKIFLSCFSRMIIQMTFTALAHMLFTGVPLNPTSSLTASAFEMNGNLNSSLSSVII